jgi:sigma-B regulation protein RsbU (phosphoserine phosphatase)
LRVLGQNQTKTASAQHVPRRILVVDDSKMQRKILSASLRRWGFQVEEAGTGEEAMRMCRNDPPDIILSDWMMPGMSGPDFCRAFRRLDGDYYAYFILLTSKAEKNEVAEGLDSGADDFLTKPVNTGELRARLTAGERILDMQRELTRKNSLIEETLYELQRVYDSLDSDLIEAKKLQQSLVRDRFVDFGAAQISQILRSAGRVGGDLVGYYPIGSDRLCIYSIDVSGHGVSSALMTARLAGLLNSAVPNRNVGLAHANDHNFAAVAPDEIAKRLNKIALTEMQSEHYFTLALADFDLVSGAFRLVQAGHPHPVIQRANGEVELIGKGGLPIGLIDGADYDLVEAQLSPGDRLLLMSDGVIECADAQDELLGEEGLITLMSDLQSVRGTGLLESMVWKLAQRRPDEVLDDDVSAIMLEFNGQ